MNGTLDLKKNKLIIHEGETPTKDDWEKDIGFMAPEVPASIFAEEGVTEVTVIMSVRTEYLTNALAAVGEFTVSPL